MAGEGDDGREGGGTTSGPDRRPSLPSIAGGVDTSGRRTRPTILLVDDERLVRRTIARVLGRVGSRVFECQTSEEALRILGEEDAVQILLTDVSLGDGTNGKELADAARAEHPDLAVVFTTGLSEIELGERGVDPEQEHVLLKPFTPQQLVAALREALEEAYLKRQRRDQQSSGQP